MERESSNSTQAVTLSNTNPSDPLLVQSSPRRLSLDATTAHSNYDDNASSQQSAFYLKHQNRALAELLQKQTIRRSHCFKIFQSVQHLVNVWKMSVSNENHHASHVLSKRVEENQLKISQLEDSVTLANRSLEQVRVRYIAHSDYLRLS